MTQSGGGPSAFVASQPPGNCGGVNESKLSLRVRANQQSGHGNGVGSGRRRQGYPFAARHLQQNPIQFERGHVMTRLLPPQRCWPQQLKSSKGDAAVVRIRCAFWFMIMTPLRSRVASLVITRTQVRFNLQRALSMFAMLLRRRHFWGAHASRVLAIRRPRRIANFSYVYRSS